MNKEISIKFSEKETAPDVALLGSVSSENSTEANETSVVFAKILLGVFGLLFAIAVPIGMISGEKGILTKTDSESTVIGSDYPYNPYTQESLQLQTTDPMLGVEDDLNIQTEDTQALVLQISETVRASALACRRNGGNIQSGFGGQSLCESSSTGNDIYLGDIWPALSICGPAPEDTRWTVFRGDADTWDITISCAFRKECNGPSNALCTEGGCTFSDTCLPSGWNGMNQGY